MEHFKECRLCKERYAGCHSKCEKYINARKRYDKDKEEIDKRKLSERGIMNYEHDLVSRHLRGKARKQYK